MTPVILRCIVAKYCCLTIAENDLLVYSFDNRLFAISVYFAQVGVFLKYYL